MKRFRFSLETVLKVKRQVEELRQRELAAAQAERDQMLARLGGHETDFRELLLERSAHRGGQIDLNDEAWFQARHMGLSGAINWDRKMLQVKDQLLEEARLRAVEAARERRVLEKLEEHQLQDYLTQLNREEQGFLDDLAQRSVSSLSLPSVSAAGR